MIEIISEVHNPEYSFLELTKELVFSDDFEKEAAENAASFLEQDKRNSL